MAQMPQMTSTRTRRLARAPLCLLAIVLLNLSLAPCEVEGTFILIGGACLVGLRAASRLVGDLIAERGLEGPIEQVGDVCRALVRFSLPGIAINDLLPLVRNLVEVTAESAVDLTNPANFDNFERIIREIAAEASFSAAGKR